MSRRLGWGLLVGANALLWLVLSFYQMTDAAPPQAPQLPFANSIEQRMDVVAQLREINVQLRELNALLRSGELKVVVRDVRP